MLDVTLETPSPPVRFTRRTLLRAGTLGAAGLTLPGLWRPRAATGAEAADLLTGFGRAKRCLLLFLTGGPAQHDTWDPKPRASDAIRGETEAIETSLTGVRFGGLFPRLAQHAHRLCVLRSYSHSDSVHTSAGYTALTGIRHPLANSPAGAVSAAPTANDHPHPGSILARHRPGDFDVPAFVSLPEVIRDAAVYELPGQTAGFLGKRYDPLRLEPHAQTGRLGLPDATLQAEISLERLSDRRMLVEQLEKARLNSRTEPRWHDFAGLQDRAYALLQSPRVHNALRVDDEPAQVRAAYGTHLFGRGCLTARRLLEAGVGLVTVYWHYEGPEDSPVWDSHWNHFRHLRERLAPPTDQALSALFDDLAERGLLDETLVVCLGEFGRSPRINKDAGRDHWPQVASVILAGAATPAGAVIGASDADGAYPQETPVAPADLTATILHQLGVPPGLELHDLTGRAVRASDGVPIAPLLSGEA